MIGEVLGGRYEIARRVGKGGMGQVFEGRHLGTSRRVAIKVISPEHALTPRVLARFETEAKVAGAIESQHIAQVLDVGFDEAAGVPFLVMEYLVGEDLSALLARRGALGVDLALRIAAQACRGLERAHALSIVHRDLKPANIFLAEVDGGECRVKVVDFGIAKVLRDELEQSQLGLTRSGARVGSPLYMSPEQAQGKIQEIDHRTDLWALGVVLFEMLTGAAPLAHVKGAGEIMIRICHDPIPDVRSLAPWVPEPVAAIVARALRIPQAERFQSAAELSAALAAQSRRGTTLTTALLEGREEEVVDAGTAPSSPERSQSGPPATPASAPRPLSTLEAQTTMAAVSEDEERPRRAPRALLPLVLGGAAFAIAAGVLGLFWSGVFSGASPASRVETSAAEPSNAMRAPSGAASLEPFTPPAPSVVPAVVAASASASAAPSATAAIAPSAAPIIPRSPPRGRAPAPATATSLPTSTTNPAPTYDPLATP